MHTFPKSRFSPGLLAVSASLILAFPSVSHAHFLWLLTSGPPSASKVQVFFGEAAEPDDPDLLSKVVKAEAWVVGGRGEPKALELRQVEATLEAALDQPATVILRHTYGVTTRGGQSFLLQYYAKTYPTSLPGTWRPVRDDKRLALEVTPALDPNGTRLNVTWHGQPQSNATVSVVGPGIDGKLEGTTDAAGNFLAKLPSSGVYSILARHVEPTAGKLGDQAYESVRHYSTLTLQHSPATLAPTAHKLPALPKGTTSFGGAIVGDSLFVYGGNYGSAHGYANEDQSGDLWKLDLKKPGAWEKVGSGTKLQGLAMVEFRGGLYRVGGFTAMNKPGEKEDLRSQNEFARRQPDATTWESLPGLPEPRSSHDAALVGTTLYVVGGWNMQGGGQSAKWHDTVLSMNLAAEKPEWKTVANPPFKRRALAVAAWQGKLYCVGGMLERGSPTTAVTVFDPATNAWSDGPPLVGNGMEGFGASAFACRDSLYVTTISGSIQRLTTDAKQWEFVGQLNEPRFFHRLLAWQGDKLIAVGGASMEQGKTESVELLAPR